ncbi:T9SS type A sorting domain-containing protein, partial [bacterium]|nr:T9SS type A sorting domain-containing protein [bacterium]
SANFRIEPEGSIPNLGLINIVNENGDSCDIYYNLFTDPLFSDTINYYLSDSSPCINAGDPSLPWDPDSTPPDIGVHYYDTTTWIFEPDIKKPDRFDILCYPNPFNGIVNIKISGLAPLDDAGYLTGVEIFDINGRMVYEFPLYSRFNGRVSPTNWWQQSFPRSAGEGCLTPLYAEFRQKGGKGQVNRPTHIRSFTWTPDKSLCSGIYFIKATIGNQSITKQVIYLK